MKNGAGEMRMSEVAKQNPWAQHYEMLLNVECKWDPEQMSIELAIPITIFMGE